MSVTLTKPSREYTDVDFIFTKHPITKTLPIKKGSNAVKQAIKNLMTLKEGDVPFHPEIKSPIYSYLFENESAIMKVVLEGEVKKYLTVYEPRVIIENVVIDFPNPHYMTCDIYGTIINLSEPFTVNILIDRLR